MKTVHPASIARLFGVTGVVSDEAAGNEGSADLNDDGDGEHLGELQRAGVAGRRQVTVLAAATPDLAGVSSVNEVAPVDPTMATRKTPFSFGRASEEQADSPLAGNDFQPVKLPRFPADNVTGIANYGFTRLMFYVAPQKKHRSVRPWMVMESAVVVALPDVVQINIAEIVARNDPPATKVVIPDDEIRWPRCHQPFRPLLHGRQVRCERAAHTAVTFLRSIRALRSASDLCGSVGRYGASLLSVDSEGFQSSRSHPYNVLR